MKLIIHADDAGVDNARNRGIFEAIDQGVVKSLSVIVYQTGWADIVDRLRVRPDIDAGVHLNLTAGRPLADGHRTLVTEWGYFFDKFELFKRSRQGLIDPEEVKREFQAQIEILVNCGIKISHADGHNHVHLLAGAREGFKEAVPQGMWVRLPHQKDIDPFSAEGINFAAIYKDEKKLAGVFNTLSIAARNLWGDKFRYVDDFCGVTLTPRPTLEGFKKAIEGLKGDTGELMCHPGAKADEHSAEFSKLKERQAEVEILKSADLKKFIEDSKIELISYKDLA